MSIAHVYPWELEESIKADRSTLWQLNQTWHQPRMIASLKFNQFRRGRQLSVLVSPLGQIIYVGNWCMYPIPWRTVEPSCNYRSSVDAVFCSRLCYTSTDPLNNVRLAFRFGLPDLHILPLSLFGEPLPSCVSNCPYHWSIWFVNQITIVA